MNRLLASGLAVLLLLAACGRMRAVPTAPSREQPAPTLQPIQSEAGIAGVVMLGPLCPVQREDQPCPDEPFQATLIVEDLHDGREVARVRSGEDGRFRVELPPGSYRLAPQDPEPGVPPHAAPQRVTVPAGRFVEVTVSYDSGIR